MLAAGGRICCSGIVKTTILILSLFLVGFESRGVADGAPMVLAGGVAGVEALAAPENSATFRAEGGGLYLHNSGWGKLDPVRREATLKAFAGRPVAIELGFAPGGRAIGWAKRLKSGYLDAGIRPLFIAANAFAENNRPGADQWAAYSKTLRDAGLPDSTLVLPTFEYANFAPNIPGLAENTVTKSPVFQAIIREAGGIVLDTPSGYFFGREENYRLWVKDAIRWTRQAGGKVVIILSPHKSGAEFANHSRRYLEWLHRNQVMPDWIVVENYNPKPEPDYPNRVGRDTDEVTALGCGLMTLRWLKARDGE